MVVTTADEDRDHKLPITKWQLGNNSPILKSIKSSSSSPNGNIHRSLLFAYFWGALSAFGLLSLFSGQWASSPESVLQVVEPRQHHKLLLKETKRQFSSGSSDHALKLQQRQPERAAAKKPRHKRSQQQGQRRSGEHWYHSQKQRQQREMPQQQWPQHQQQWPHQPPQQHQWPHQQQQQQLMQQQQHHQPWMQNPHQQQQWMQQPHQQQQQQWGMPQQRRPEDGWARKRNRRTEEEEDDDDNEEEEEDDDDDDNNEADDDVVKEEEQIRRGKKNGSEESQSEQPRGKKKGTEFEEEEEEEEAQEERVGKKGNARKRPTLLQPPQQQDGVNNNEQPAPTALAGLSCQKYGGPNDEAAAEMVYWEDIPSDNVHKSPFFAPNRYLTFEPDVGGWNNIRMGMETTIALAYAMGRTLVLPPSQKMYLLNKAHNNTSPRFSFADFFDMPSIDNEHSGLEIISTEEFLKRQMASDEPELRVLPKQTNFDGHHKQFNSHMRQYAKNLIWDPFQCLAYFPESADAEMDVIRQRFRKVLQSHGGKTDWKNFVDRPTPLDASESYRLAEFAAGRKNLCLYRPQLQHEGVLHVPAELPEQFQEEEEEEGSDNGKKNKKKNKRSHRDFDPRLLVHSYAFLFFPDVHQELWLKRFMRDHVRYTDEIQCAAARVVAAMRKKAKLHGKVDGKFQTIHVRRGDFQYEDVRVSAQEILEAIQKEFNDGDVVFIATDQKEKDFFNPLRRHYTLYFLDDFLSDGTVGPEVNSNYYGMMDQLIASRGQKFFGCWFSTFTGYIMRLRGYHSQLEKLPGYEEGKLLNSFYYVHEDKFGEMTKYQPIHEPIWAREFPTAWRLLNRDVSNETPGARYESVS